MEERIESSNNFSLSVFLGIREKEGLFVYKKKREKEGLLVGSTAFLSFSHVFTFLLCFFKRWKFPSTIRLSFFFPTVFLGNKQSVNLPFYYHKENGAYTHFER